ncbi:MAG: hypothetical protein RQM92_04450 [Candidatus Syntrophopropionicum ammoniitolerans]
MSQLLWFRDIPPGDQTPAAGTNNHLSAVYDAAAPGRNVRVAFIAVGNILKTPVKATIRKLVQVRHGNVWRPAMTLGQIIGNHLDVKANSKQRCIPHFPSPNSRAKFNAGSHSADPNSRSLAGAIPPQERANPPLRGSNLVGCMGGRPCEKSKI